MAHQSAESGNAQLVAYTIDNGKGKEQTAML